MSTTLALIPAFGAMLGSAPLDSSAALVCGPMELRMEIPVEIELASPALPYSCDAMFGDPLCPGPLQEAVLQASGGRMGPSACVAQAVRPSDPALDPRPWLWRDPFAHSHPPTEPPEPPPRR